MKTFWDNGIFRKRKRYWLLLLAVFLAIMVCMVEKAEIYGESMCPYLMDGDRVLAEKFSCTIGRPKRFDVVIFRYRYERNRYYTKRIIGLPGETVQIIAGEVMINGEKLIEENEYEAILDPGRAKKAITLGQDEYFVLGDNRNHSADSRSSHIGNVKKEDLIGRVFWLFPAEQSRNSNKEKG